ncbi:MAG TPA: cupin domain-containing protein [Pyrinomonadaceae bacterium]|nr:cupin domain-containing protein [Pyrinomonadaceae bacterium]
MTRFRFMILISAVLIGISFVLVQAKKPQHKMGAAKHIATTPDELKWGPAPPGLPPGAELAVVSGDPSKAGAPFTMRAKFPDGYKVPPHWHPTDENVTVIQGTINIGMGDKFDESAAKQLPAGSFALMPKRMHHFAWASGETIVQIHGTGPFAITYVNPADDPRHKSK